MYSKSKLGNQFPYCGWKTGPELEIVNEYYQPSEWSVRPRVRVFVFYQLFGATGENNVKLSHCRFREHFKTFPRARTVDTTQKKQREKNPQHAGTSVRRFCSPLLLASLLFYDWKASAGRANDKAYGSRMLAMSDTLKIYRSIHQ